MPLFSPNVSVYDSSESNPENAIEKEEKIGASEEENIENGTKVTDQITKVPNVVTTRSVMYQNRDILDLSYLSHYRDVVKYTLLPQNNLACFFQNRAQYWRLSTNDPKEMQDTRSCHCCEFEFPSLNQPNYDLLQEKHEITNSLKAFLKSSEPVIQMSPFNCSNISQSGYQDQYQNKQNYGFYNMRNNSQNFSPKVNSFAVTEPIHNFMNNAPRNVAANFLQTNSNHAYNSAKTMGLYRQF